MSLPSSAWVNTKVAADELGFTGNKNPRKCLRQFLQREGVPTDKRGRAVVILRSSLEELKKRQRRNNVRRIA